MPGKRVTKVELALIKKLINNGMPIRTAAQLVGRSERTIHRIFKRLKQ